MATRRHTPPVNALSASREVSWIIAVDNWGGVLDSRQLPAGTDLYDALVREHLRYHAEGWQQERMFYNREFHVRRHGQTPRRVYITGSDPTLVRLETDGRYDRNGFEFQAPSTWQRWTK
jgi:hypothetical protein